MIYIIYMIVYLFQLLTNKNLPIFVHRPKISYENVTYYSHDSKVNFLDYIL